MLTCNSCNQLKSKNDFYIRKDTGEYRSSCKKCCSHISSLRYNKRSQILVKRRNKKSILKKDLVIQDLKLVESYKIKVEGKTKIWWKCINLKTKEIIDYRSDNLLQAINKKNYRFNNMIEYEEAAFNRLLRQYKTGAKKRSKEFNLTIQQFKEITSTNCHYCNKPPEQIIRNDYKSNKFYKYNGIDRKDNAIGYIFNNCLSCCKNCNKMKLDQSYEDFLKCIKNIYLHLCL